jgi:hypothetical protein
MIRGPLLISFAPASKHLLDVEFKHKTRSSVAGFWEIESGTEAVGCRCAIGCIPGFAAKMRNIRPGQIPEWP